MVEFNSEAIASAEYDENTQRMTIRFNSGHDYDYCGVPKSVWEGLCSARSAGTYFHQHIANRYQC
jgi:hypothetical protein